MCRQVALHITRNDNKLVQGLLDSLLLASKRDHRNRDRSHCDGFGYVTLYYDNGGWGLDYYKFDAWRQGVRLEESCKRNLEELARVIRDLKSRISSWREAYLIIHSRRASPGSPRGTLNVHPFMVTVKGSEFYTELYLAHNGSVDKEALSVELGINDGAGWVDSHLLAIWIAERLRSNRNILSILRDAERFTEKALQLSILVISRDKNGSFTPSLYWHSHIPSGVQGYRRSYYMHFLVEGGGVKGFASSTVIDYLRDIINLDDYNVSVRPVFGSGCL